MAESVASLCSSISEAYEIYLAELRQAGPHWEKKPEGGSGEDAWCAKQVAEHVAGTAGFFGAGIAKAAGLEGPGRTGGEFATAEDAVAAIPGDHAKLMAVVTKVNDDQLGMEVEFGPLGKTNLGNVLGVVAYHLNDHAGQLKALRA